MRAGQRLTRARKLHLTATPASFMMTSMVQMKVSVRIALMLCLVAGVSCGMPLPFLATPTPLPTSTPTPTLTPTPTETPTPTSTPTPIPPPDIQLRTAQQALFFGDWDTALGEFQSALLAAEDDQIRAGAQLGIGLTLLQAKRYSEALQALNDYLLVYPDHDQRGQAYFLRAKALAALGDETSAIQEYDLYLQHRPEPLHSYVQEQVGDALRRLGSPLEAIRRYQMAMETSRLSGTLGLSIKISHAYFEAGDYPSASAMFAETSQGASDSKTKAALNLMAGRSLEAMGDYQGAYQRYQNALYQFPKEYETYLGLITLVNEGIEVNEFQRGLVDYYAGAYGPALAAFDRFIAQTPTGTVYFYRALTRRALGDPYGALEDLQLVIEGYIEDPMWTEAWLEKAATLRSSLSDSQGAVATYLAFVDAAPASARAPEALYTAARITERLGELERAAALWGRIPNEYPAYSLVFRSALLSGVSRYRLSQYAQARDAFLLADSISGTSGERAAAQLWAGKTYHAEGDIVSAEAAWAAAAQMDPTGYYSLRAEELLQGLPPLQPSSGIHFEQDMGSLRSQAESWLRARFTILGGEPLSSLDAALSSDGRMLRGKEFWSVGLYSEARAEFEALRKAHEGNAEATYRLMHTFLDLGLYRSAIFASRQILNLAGMDDAGTMSAPTYFNLIRFGLYFPELVLPEAERYGFDPLFAYALIRQESLFEGFITSYADARGLVQIIPSTGQGIASKLGWPPGYQVDDLYRPYVSVRLGMDYLADQRALLDGDLYAALAAYNAGPGNSMAWKELAPDDPDLFLEVVRFEQPQLYIRMISEIYAIYRHLYAIE